MSKAFDISKLVSDRLALILSANGYGSNIGERVYRGKRRIDSSCLPCCVVAEADDNTESEALRSASLNQTYIIEAHAECDPDNPNDVAHVLIADMKKAIFGGDKNLGDFVRKIKYKGRSILPREDGTSAVAASIVVQVLYVEDLTNP